MVQANRARFSLGVPQPEASIALCPLQRRLAVAEAGEKREVGRKIVGIWLMPGEKLIKIGAKIVSHGRYVTFQLAEVAVPRRMFADTLSLVARLRATPAPA